MTNFVNMHKIIMIVVMLLIQTPFKRMARNMEDLTGDGAVLKKILRQGTGPVVPQGSTVRCKH